MLLFAFIAEVAVDKGVFDYVQYGVLGLIVMGFLLGLIWAKPAVDRLLKDKEAAEEQRDSLIDTYNNKVFPLLKEVETAIVPAIAELTEAVRELRRDLMYFGRSKDV